MTAPADDLIAIASGTKARVAGWSKLLRAESIEYEIATPCHEAAADEPDHVELWVHKADAARAKSILRASSSDDEAVMW